MKNITTRTKVLASLLLLAVVFLPGRWSLQSLATANTQADDVRAQAAVINDSAAEAEAVRSDRAAFDARALPYVTAVPDDPDFAGLIDSVSAAADAAGVELRSGSPSSSSSSVSSGGSPDEDDEDAPSGSVREWELDMEVTGPAQGVAVFLDSVRNSPRLVVIDSLDLSTDSDGVVTLDVESRFFSTGGLR